MKISRLLSVPMLSLMMFCALPAHALQVFDGHITVLESTYMPARISFTMDVDTACLAGQWLFWSDTASSQATYSTMLAALLANKKVRVHFEDTDTTCTVKFFHILNQN